jgi:hypothetical protein
LLVCTTVPFFERGAHGAVGARGAGCSYSPVVLNLFQHPAGKVYYKSRLVEFFENERYCFLFCQPRYIIGFI